MLEEYINEFIEYIKNHRGHSGFTQVNYRHDLLQFDNFLKTRFPGGIESPKEIKPYTIRAFLAGFRESGYKASSIERKVASLRAFFKFLYVKGLIDLNPARYVVVPRKERTLPGFLDYSQIESAITNIRGDTAEIYRDLVIFELLYATGIRLRELSGLRTSDIFLPRMVLRVMGKGAKERMAHFGEPAKFALERYLEHRKELLKGKADSGILLLNRRGEPLSPRGVEYIVKKHMSKIPGARTNPHAFRHSFATHLLSRGAPLLEIKELLGHSSLSTTQRYIHLQLEQLKDTHKRTHPRG